LRFDTVLHRENVLLRFRETLMPMFACPKCGTLLEGTLSPTLRIRCHNCNVELAGGAIPGTAFLARDFDRLGAYYRQRQAEGKVGINGFMPLVYVAFPMVNWLLLPKTIPLCALIVLLDIPLDLLVNVVTNFIFTIRRWGLAPEMNFLEGFLIQMLTSFSAMPSMVMCVVHLRGMRG